MLHLDIESFSSVDLKTAGVYRYAASPDFEVLMCGWAPDLNTPATVAIGEEAIRAIPGLFDPHTVKVAHNAAFERICLSVLDPRIEPDSGQYMDPKEFIDVQAWAALSGYPQKLVNLAKALGSPAKDSAGTRLINLFSKPYRGRRVMPWERPEQWAEFVAYCAQDVDVMTDVEKRLPPWPTEAERLMWIVDQRINDRGIKVDIALAEAAVEAAEDNAVEQRAEVIEITDVDNPGSVQQLGAWFERAGHPMPDFRADTVSEHLTREDLTAEVRRVLELRQELALSAAKKFVAALNSTSEFDGRFRGGFQYHGAHTGRWSGRRIQLQNLPQSSFADAEGEFDEPAQTLAIAELMGGMGLPASELKSLLRPMLAGPFTVADYAAIEARILAWLAGERWALQAFRDGRDIYVETAQRMGGLTRSQGKVAVLALGYNGGVNSLRVMGAQGTDAELDILKNQWRRANAEIVRYWQSIERVFWLGGKVGRIEIVRRDRTRSIILPSGRALNYHGVSRSSGERGTRITFDDPKGFRADTYGGRLVENITQAVARDVLAHALIELDRAGLPVVGHVHDEVIVEGVLPVEEVSVIMCDLPAWAEGLPMSAEGFVTERYRKG